MASSVWLRAVEDWMVRLAINCCLRSDFPSGGLLPLKTFPWSH